MTAAPAPAVCWVCDTEIVRGRCECSEAVQTVEAARVGLLLGLRNAVLLELVLLGGIGAGMQLVWGWPGGR